MNGLGRSVSEWVMRQRTVYPAVNRKNVEVNWSTQRIRVNRNVSSSSSISVRWRPRRTLYDVVAPNHAAGSWWPLSILRRCGRSTVPTRLPNWCQQAIDSDEILRARTTLRLGPSLCLFFFAKKSPVWLADGCSVVSRGDERGACSQAHATGEAALYERRLLSRRAEDLVAARSGWLFHGAKIHPVGCAQDGCSMAPKSISVCFCSHPGKSSMDAASAAGCQHLGLWGRWLPHPSIYACEAWLSLLVTPEYSFYCNGMNITIIRIELSRRSVQIPHA
jgi:hypothetical protein